MSSESDHCPYGHEKTAENWRQRSARGKTHFYCRPCDLAGQERRREARRVAEGRQKRSYDPLQFPCGHERSPENTVGGRHCRECKRLRRADEAERARVAAGKTKRVMDPQVFPCGHPRVEENTLAGKNACRECNRLRSARRHQARLDAAGKQKRVYDPLQFPCGHPRSPENMTKNRGCRACHAQRNREWWYQIDPIARKVQGQDRRLRNLERLREYDRQRSPLRPRTELARLSNQARAQDRFNPETRAYLTIVMKDPCVYCGGPADTRDHIVPISAGGPNRWDNYAPACNGCNASKNDQPLLAFLLNRRLMLEYRQAGTTEGVEGA